MLSLWAADRLYSVPARWKAFIFNKVDLHSIVSWIDKSRTVFIVGN